MRVLAIPSDTGACGSYRVHWPARAVALARPDWDVRTVNPRTFQFARNPYTREFVVRGLDLDGVDVVHLQRVGSPNSVEFMRWCQRQGVAVVVDFDDAMWAIDRDNVAWRDWNGRGPRGDDVHWRWCDDAARVADLVTVTTSALAKRYGEHGRTEVIPNYLPDRALASWDDIRDRRAKRNGDPVRIGWAGSLGVHPHDLDVAAPAVAWAVRELGAELHVVGGGGDRAAKAFGLDPHEVTVHPAVSLADYHAALDVFDVGIVPLADSKFNAAKSWLKALEYAGRGLAVVASETPANRLLGKAVSAVSVVSTVGAWKFALEELVTHPPALWDAQTQARDAARHLTLEVRANDWAKAYERAAARRTSLHD
jgi:glycosyltransferase involved in cell wall biosynthesis